MLHSRECLWWMRMLMMNENGYDAYENAYDQIYQTIICENAVYTSKL